MYNYIIILDKPFKQANNNHAKLVYFTDLSLLKTT